MKKILLCLVAGCFCSGIVFSQTLPTPSGRQLQWQQMETNAFLHFTVNTFTDREWGEGTESEAVFNPTKFDARQWIKALKDAGFKMAILTAKHHDGFCLWPSAYTTHSVKNSPWKNGKGDVVKEVADACREYGLKFGVYLSPWDRHEPSYGTPAYNTYYKNQLKELLTNYGEISEVWFDGAKGENAKDMQYDFKGYWNIVRELQPKAVIFSDAGPDVRWVGNESGNAGQTCWSTIDTVGMAPGKANPAYLNTGDANGKCWIPAETDVSIRPGWFYHAAENDKVKTPQQLVNLYYQSAGHNSLLLLNIPPNREGLLSQQDVENIKTFREIVNETFKINFAKNKVPSSLTDKKLNTFISLTANHPYVIDFKKVIKTDRAMLQENIANGQRIIKGLLEYWDGSSWKKMEEFTTVGYKRLFRFKEIASQKIRLTVLESKGKVQLAEVGFFKASTKE
ncbi:alpha-L-fucosidase [Ginsengibacter hankyongi]|uniref:alpha-L-fucosidase n=1 Tax=Ginsengibacter hankyongi TaxID=2607284 RepID=A0A5J5IIC8_9BACT|nr:alpha-L-fucosidase [Ginsengibacter hankyongi]KAA9039092.1 alpha-L-fucosidase [Ginsengibacter hankyongi]